MNIFDSKVDFTCTGRNKHVHVEWQYTEYISQACFHSNHSCPWINKYNVHFIHIAWNYLINFFDLI